MSRECTSHDGIHAIHWDCTLYSDGTITVLQTGAILKGETK